MAAMSGKALEGRVAVVTGASSGIGTAVSLQLAKAGAKVVLAARRQDVLQKVLEAIQKAGGTAMAVKCDVTNRVEVRKMVKQAYSRLGPVDTLVNCAGVFYLTLMKNLKEDQWHSQIDVNCKGVVNCVGAVLAGMTQRRQGHIVTMSLDAGLREFPGMALLSATNSFVEGLSRTMEKELGGTGVKVTCITHGKVNTEILKHTTDDEAKQQYSPGSEGKGVEPDEIARQVLDVIM